MARRKTAGNKSSSSINNLTGLLEPFPSSPTRPPKYAVYCYYPAHAPAGQSRMIVMTFAAAYAARHFINAVLQDGGYKWLPADKKMAIEIPDTIVGDNDVRIRVPGGSSLEDLMEYEFSDAEAEWELPQGYVVQSDLLRREYREEAPPPTDEDGNPAPKEKKPRREPKPEKIKIDKSGLVSVGDIADQMGIEARDARGSLRKQKVEKPDVGWCWPESEVEAIKKIIKKGLK